MKKNYYLLILALGTMFHLTATENSHKYLRLSSNGKVVFGVTDDGAMQTHITIPKGVTTIGALAFRGCYALKSITIPKGVTTIGAQAFNQCEFKTIYYDGTKEEWDDIVDGLLGFDDEVTVIGKGGSWVDW